ncbi:hypothetical protein [Rhodopseudomonas sp. RCAM05734]|uniref:hypothetical protein n=1 Tax=Rhodopseudomonas sp. RCAM05734 TaxID=3457549 RepID=UPI004044CC01
MPIRLALIVLLGSLVLPCFARAEPPKPLAITDPVALRQLDAGDAAHPGFGIGRMLDPAAAGAAPIANDALFARPAMAGMRTALDTEFARFVAGYRADEIGVGPGHAVQLFDRAALDSGAMRFVLSGIVSRMDRAFIAPETCGEVRLLYRLMRLDSAAGPARLPMTLNLVLNGRSAADTAIDCAEIARRWLAVVDLPNGGADLAARLTAPDGALALVTPDHIDRIEINLQIAHTPKSELRDFRTHYLQKVFRLDAQTGKFEQAPLENQIDRDRILADDGLRRALREWLLDPRHFAELDRGTLLIPRQFLATASVAATPVGFVRSSLQPAFGLMASDEASTSAVFTASDVVAALQAAAAQGIALQNIRSPAGFERRLNDISCGGCHQIRGIGGFHFPGVDTSRAHPNAANVPASPHFVGDQPRRRDIAMAMRAGRAPDFSRGFSDRPQEHRSAMLAGSEHLDGWGATCLRPGATAADMDISFASWTCAKGLSCQPTGEAGSSRLGMCFVGTK